MLFQIVQPIVTDIYGDSFKEAIKNYVKLNYNANITNMVIKDQNNHYQTRLRYYQENNKNKVGIDVYPYTNMSYPIIQPGPFIQSPSGPFTQLPLGPFIQSPPIITTQPIIQPGPIIQSPIPITIVSKF